jgi:hypothetical protein
MYLLHVILDHTPAARLYAAVAVRAGRDLEVGQDYVLDLRTFACGADDGLIQQAVRVAAAAGTAGYAQQFQLSTALNWSQGRPNLSSKQVMI